MDGELAPAARINSTQNEGLRRGTIPASRNLGLFRTGIQLVQVFQVVIVNVLGESSAHLQEPASR